MYNNSDDVIDAQSLADRLRQPQPARKRLQNTMPDLNKRIEKLGLRPDRQSDRRRHLHGRLALLAS